MSCIDELPEDYKGCGKIEKLYITNVNQPFLDIYNTEEWKRRIALPNDHPEKIIEINVGDCKKNPEEVKHTVSFTMKINKP